MKRMFAVAMFVTIVAGLVLAQGPPMPKAQPEHQKLQYFAGEWKSEGEAKASPFGPGGKFTSTDRNQMLGDFFLAIHSEGSGPMGPIKEVAVLGYDAKAKHYTYDGYSSMGQHETSTGTISGDTWTWHSPEQTMGGKRFKGRFTLKEVSPTSYTFIFESSADDGPWTKVMEGKATKVK